MNTNNEYYQIQMREGKNDNEVDLPELGVRLEIRPARPFRQPARSSGEVSQGHTKL